MSTFNELKGRIIGLAMEIEILSEDLKSIEVDLCYLDALQNDLTYNIGFLKQDEITSILNSYKLSIEQLSEVRDKIIKFNKLRDKLLDKIERKTQDMHSNILEFKSDTNKILPFRRRDDG